MHAHAQLQKACLITNEEGKRLGDIADVVAVQSSKSHDVSGKMAVIMRECEFVKQAEVLPGKET